MARGRKTGGRLKGTPNRVTMNVREALSQLANGMAPRVEGWLTQVADVDPKLAPSTSTCGRWNSRSREWPA